MKLFFRKYGNGPPLVILHGLYGSSDNWVTIAKRISDTFSVYLPDLRNHGQSPHSDIHDYDALASDIFELTEDLKIGKFILAGHSMGGKVAMEFALKWPERLNSLIVIDISPFGSHENSNTFLQQHKDILEAVLSIKPDELRKREDAESLLRNRINSEKIIGVIMKNLRREVNGSFIWKMNVASLASNLNAIVDSIIPDEIEVTPVTGLEVTFVRGELSDYLKPGELKEIQKIFPSAEMVIIKGAGHWVHADKPEEITKLLLSQINP